jgi:hypothetical protein
MNERKLTQLEAAMLGLWLMGFAFVRTTGGHFAFANEGGIADSPFFNGLMSMDSCLSVRDVLYSGLGVDATVELLPWLTAHNVPIPEVEA